MSERVFYRSSNLVVTPSMVRFGEGSIATRQVVGVRLGNEMAGMWLLFKISGFTSLACAAIAFPVVTNGFNLDVFGTAYGIAAILAIYLVGPIALGLSLICVMILLFQKLFRGGGYFILLTASNGSITQINVASAKDGREIKDAIEQAMEGSALA